MKSNKLSPVTLAAFLVLGGQGQPMMFGQNPSAATGVSVQALGPRKMQVSWTDQATDEAGYVVERSLASGGPTWISSGGLPANTTSYEDSQGLKGNTLIIIA